MSRKSRPASFWQTVPMEQLVAEQGVTPIKNLEEIDELWPVDDDPDALLEFILSERAARRRLARCKRKIV